MPQNARIWNNQSDAGAWLSILTGHPITHPHLGPFLYPYLPKPLPVGTPTHLFFGGKKIHQRGNTFNIEEIQNKPHKYRLIYQQGKAQLYEIMQPYNNIP